MDPRFTNAEIIALKQVVARKNALYVREPWRQRQTLRQHQPAIWVKAMETIAKGESGKVQVLELDPKSPTANVEREFDATFIGPADQLEQNAMIIARWTDFEFTGQDEGGGWFIETANTGSATDPVPGGGNACTCALIELLMEKDHLSDITKEEWDEINEKCNCGAEIVSGCSSCMEQDGIPNASSEQVQLVVQGVTGVDPVPANPDVPAGFWDAVAEEFNGTHELERFGDTEPNWCQYNKTWTKTDIFAGTFERVEFHLGWDWVDGRMLLAVTAYYPNQTFIRESGDYDIPLDDPDNFLYDCVKARPNLVIGWGPILQPELGGLQNGTADMSTGVPQVKNPNKQPPGTTVHFVGDLGTPSPASLTQATRALKNQMATESGYLGIANKNTDDGIVPLPVGLPFTPRERTGTWPDPPPEQPITSAALWVGHRYQTGGGEAFTKLNTQLWIPSAMVGFDVEVWEIRDPTGVPQLTPVIPNFTIAPDDVEKWLTVPRSYNITVPGQVVDIVARYGSRAGPVSFAYDWDYQWSNGDPASGEMYQQNGDRSDLRVHQEDWNGVDRTAELDMITSGSTIDVIGMTWEVLTASKIGSVYYFEVLPATRGAEGLQPVTFTYFGAVPKSYVEVPNYYAAAPYTKGLFGTEYDPDTIVPNDNGYGLDILVQELDLSEDWDILSTQ